MDSSKMDKIDNAKMDDSKTDKQSVIIKQKDI